MIFFLIFFGYLLMGWASTFIGAAYIAWVESKFNQGVSTRKDLGGLFAAIFVFWPAGLLILIAHGMWMGSRSVHLPSPYGLYSNIRDREQVTK